MAFRGNQEWRGLTIDLFVTEVFSRDLIWFFARTHSRLCWSSHIKAPLWLEKRESEWKYACVHARNLLLHFCTKQEIGVMEWLMRQLAPSGFSRFHFTRFFLLYYTFPFSNWHWRVIYISVEITLMQRRINVDTTSRTLTRCWLNVACQLGNDLECGSRDSNVCTRWTAEHVTCKFLNVCLFVCLIDSLRPINNLSVKQGRVFLGLTSTKLG